MKRVPFSIIEAAKQCDTEAVEFVRRHFAGYIVNSSLKHYDDTCVSYASQYRAPRHGYGGRHGNFL